MRAAVPGEREGEGHRATGVVAAGLAVGVLGGLIGLGGAEFRLPLLIGVFGFAALHAVILNKAMSLVVVAAALPARLAGVPIGEVAGEWSVMLNLLAGSLVGAWLGASAATRMTSRVLYRVIAVLLLGMAVVLLATHQGTLEPLTLGGTARVATGVVAGLGIGAVAAVMGVAGGELLIPTIVLLYGVPIKLAGSVSLAVSLPTMVMAFARYSRDGSFAVLAARRRFVLLMAAGSLAGAVIGGLLVGAVAEDVLIPALAAVLAGSAWKVWRHDQPRRASPTTSSRRTAGADSA